MKKQACIIAFLIALPFLIVCCSKEGSGSDLNTIYGRVVEMGTDQPLSGAVFITSICTQHDDVFGCVRWNEAGSYTSTDGKFYVSRTHFRNHRLEKNGYWSYINEPDRHGSWGYYRNNHQPAPIIAYISPRTNQLDSMLIKLFPVNTITVRVRNTGALTNAILVCRAYLYGPYGKNISLRAGIDSSFQYPVFGNAENKIFILRDFPLSDSVSTQTRYIAKNEILNLDISY